MMASKSSSCQQICCTGISVTTQHKLLFVFVIIQLLSRVSAAPWTAARQASLSFTMSQSLLKPMSIESVMPPNHLILCRSPLSPLALNTSQHQDLYR